MACLAWPDKNQTVILLVCNIASGHGGELISWNELTWVYCGQRMKIFLSSPAGCLSHILTKWSTAARQYFRRFCASLSAVARVLLFCAVLLCGLCATPLSAQEAPAITKTFATSDISTGGNSDMTVTIVNVNADPITLASDFTDTFPTGMTINTVGAGTCPGLTATAGAGSFTIASGTSIPAGGCTVIINVTSSTAGAAVNTIGAGALQTIEVGNNAAPVTATLNVYAVPTVTKTFTPAAIDSSGTSSMVITVTNPSGNPANLAGVNISDSYSGTLANNAAGGVVCSGGGSATLTGGGSGDTTVGFVNGTIVPGGTCTITQSVTATSSLSNTTGAPAATGPVALTGTAAGPITLSILPGISQVFAPSNISSGSNTNLTVTISNNNSSSITLTSALTDTLPTGVTVNTAGNTGTCSGVTATAGASGFTTASGTSIPSGGCTIIVNVKSSTVGAAANTIAAGALQTSAGNNASPVTATLNVYSVPTVTKTFTPSSIASGSTSSMVITVTSPSGNPDNITGVSISDTYSGTMVNSGAGSVVCGGAGSATLTGGTNGGNTVGFSGGTIVPGGTCTITQTVTATGSADNSTTAPTATGPTALTGTAAGPTTLSMLPGISQVFTPSNISSGSNTNLTVTISNNNSTSITLTSVLTDTFPTGMTINTAGNTGTCTGVTATAGAGSFTMASGTSIPAGSCTIIVNVKSSTAGAAVNRIAQDALKTSVGNNPSEVSATLTVYNGITGALGVSVTLDAGAPTDIYPGQTTSLKITLSNSSDYPLTGVVFSNRLPGTLPDGLKVSGSPTYTCTDPSGAAAGSTGTLTATTGTQGISLSGAGGTIPARANNTDGTCTIIIPVTAGTSTGNPATYTYTIASSSVLGFVNGSTSNPVTNLGAVSQSVNVLTTAKPTISKNFGASTLYIGGSSTTLTITVTNTNTIAITNFSLRDTFPQLGGSGIIKVASTPGASASCNNGGSSPAFSPSAGDTVLNATGTVPAKSGSTNGICTFTVSVEGAQTNGAYTTDTPGQQRNYIYTTDFTNDLGLPSAANVYANITVKSPLRIAKQFHTSLSSGQYDTFTITLYNDGNTDLPITSFTDNPIDGLVGTSFGLIATGFDANTCGGTASIVSNGDGISLTGGTITHNSSCTITVRFQGTVQNAGVPITYTNTITQGAVVSSPGLVSQLQTASIIVADDLRVSKTASPTQVDPGNPVRYTVTVYNYKDSAIANLVVTDRLTNSMTFLTGTINGIVYTPSISGGCSGLTVTGSTGDTTAVFTIGTFSARTDANNPARCDITFYAMASKNAANNWSTTNTIAAGDVCYNGGTTCNGTGTTSTPSTTVTTTLFTITKSFSPAGPLSEGTTSTLTITVTNKSANPITNATISDNLPLDASGGSGQLRIASPANSSSTCGTPTITADPNGTSLAMNGGTIPARAGNGTGSDGSCFIRVDVIGPAGTYNNTASVAGTETYADGTTHSVGPVTSSQATLVYNSSLSASKSFNPTSVTSGGKSTVTVRISNAGSTALTNVGITDYFTTNGLSGGTASGLKLAPAPNAYTTCAGSPSITATAGAGFITMTGAAIAGLGNCDLLFDVVATGSSDWTNRIAVGNITADGGVRNQTAVTGTLNYAAPTAVTVAKATNPSTLTFPGQVSQLTITVTNGTQAVTNLRLTDYFTTNGTSGGTLTGMIIAPTPSASTTCPGGVLTAVAGGTSISLTGVSLAASASCTITVNITSTAVGGISNTIPAGAVITDQGLTNSGQAYTSLTTQSNIGVTKQFTPNVVKPGQRSRLRITFYNPTSLPMSGLAVTDTLPVNVTVPSGPNFSSTCTGATLSSPASNKLQISGGTMPAASGGVSASCYAESDVLVSAQGDFTNTIAAGDVTATSGGSTASNSQPTSDTIRAKSPLTIHKAIAGRTLDSGNPAGFTTGSASATPGSNATLTIRLDNPNSVALTQAAFTDTLPTNLVVATTPNAATTCASGTVTATASATSIRLAGATIPASGYCTVTVDVLSNVSGTYLNSIASSRVTTYEGVTNEEATSAQIVVSTPPTVTKQFSPAVIPPSGGVSTLTIYFSNTNSSAITLSSDFVDTLPNSPGQIYVAAAPNKASTCGGGTGAITAVASNGTSVTLASGTSIPAGGCSISVDVTGATSGVHTNTIRAGDLSTSAGTNQAAANATLTISTAGFISGKVFKDNKVTPTGIFSSSTDTPIQGVSIELHTGSNCTNALVSIAGLTNPTTSDAAGNYIFSNLTAGTYSVCQMVQPTGTVNSITTAGTITRVNNSTGTAGTASNPTSSTSQIVSIILNGDGSPSAISGSSGNNFSEIVLSSISGTVFIDQNNNGLQDGADLGIASVTIELLNSSGTVIATTTTDSSGAYSFTSLQPGTYSVREPNQPTDTANGKTIPGAVSNSGTSGTATNTATLPSMISTIVLPPNTTATGNNFAEIPLGRRISGIVFLDYNNNGSFDGSDHGIGSQTINLAGTDINGNAVTRNVNSNSDGTYDFLNLPEGTYAVTQPNQPAGTTNGITSYGSTGGTATGTSTTPSRITGIDLTGTNTVSANNNFGEQPGAASDLAIAKTHTPASLGVSSSTGYFTITPSNVGTIATTGTITVSDNMPAGLTPTSAYGTGWTCIIAGQAVTCTSITPISSGGTGNTIVIRVTVGSGLGGQILVNTAVISGGGEPVGFDGNNTASDAVAIADSASLRGTVWRDTNHTRSLDSGKPRLANWIVELGLGGVTVASTVTAADGTYTFTNISPGPGYRVRFKEPANGVIYGYAVPNESAASFSDGVVSTANPAGADTRDGTLNSLTLVAGTNYVEQSLPVDPSGIIYDSITRLPVSGATVRITSTGSFDPASHLVGGAASATQVTGSDGYYQFLLLSGAPAGTYSIAVTPPAGYVPGVSTIIPASSGPHAVAAAPGTDVIQAQATAPSGAQSTTYYLSFSMGGSSRNVVNNHIPVDPVLGGAIIVTKRTPLINVTRGDLVPYTIEVTNTLNAQLSNINLVDAIPPGFKYKVGSASMNGISAEPVITGRTMTWRNLVFAAGEKKIFRIILVVGTGVTEGEYTNQAWAINNIVNAMVSNIGQATVRVIPDATFDCPDIIGKVFDDKNANGYQDDGEPGIANVRLATVRGLLITTDSEGRFHIPCPEIPNADRGSNFLLKLDERTLPSGYRVTTENPHTVRITRGKMVKMNFGAAVHRVFRVELTDEAFEPGGVKLRPQWQGKVTGLDKKMEDRPSVVRIAYMAGKEPPLLIKERIKHVRGLIEKLWKSRGKRYPLACEEEVFDNAR